jgi:hypothetical protein
MIGTLRQVAQAGRVRRFTENNRDFVWRAGNEFLDRADCEVLLAMGAFIYGGGGFYYLSEKGERMLRDGL